MICNTLIVPVTHILSSKEAYIYTLKKNWYPTYPKNISAVKKRRGQEKQVTEWPKDVISLWGQEEKLYQLGCVYRTPAYKVNNCTLADS